MSPRNGLVNGQHFRNPVREGLPTIRPESSDVLRYRKSGRTRARVQLQRLARRIDHLISLCDVTSNILREVVKLVRVLCCEELRYTLLRFLHGGPFDVGRSCALEQIAKVLFPKLELRWKASRRIRAGPSEYDG